MLVPRVYTLFSNFAGLAACPHSVDGPTYRPASTYLQEGKRGELALAPRDLFSQAGSSDLKGTRYVTPRSTTLGVYDHFDGRWSVRFFCPGVRRSVGCPNTAHFWFPEPTKVVQAAEGSSLTLSRGRACGRWVWGASFQGWLTHRTPFPRFCGAFIKLFDELLRHPLKACRMSCPSPEPLLGYAHGSEWEPRHLDPSRLAHASRSVVTGKIPDLQRCDP